VSATILTGRPTRDELPETGLEQLPLQPYAYTAPGDFAWICAPTEALAIEVAEQRKLARRQRGQVRLVPVRMEVVA
jgi:hypothetical protein